MMARPTARDGPYRFWLSADDQATLELSPNEKPELLAQVTKLDFGMWSEPLEFDRHPAQRTRPIRLEAGKRYAIRARGHEQNGADHIVAQWTPPGGKRRAIPESALRTGS